MKTILTFCIVITLTVATLSIKRPQVLVDSFYSKVRDIPFSIANFGDIPWGHKMIGEIEMANPLDACVPLTPSNNKTFVLIKRGNCTFVNKVRNAQTAGYKLAIIEDNTIEITENLTMSDDGTGYTVKIPSIFIEQKDGEILQNYTEGRMKQFAEVQPVQLVIQFDVQQQETVQVILAISFKNRETFKLLRQFQPYYEKIKSSTIKFEFLYQLIEMSFEKYESDLPNCLGGGRYCSIDPDGYKIGTGRQVVEEAFRQLCIFQNNPDIFFKYMDAFDQNCTLIQAYDSCSNKISRVLNIDQSKTIECMQNSFYNSTTNTTIPSTQLNTALQPSTILDHQIELMKTSGIRGFPGAIINGQNYKGRIDAKDIFGEICNGYLHPPEACKEEVEVYVAPVSNNANLLYTIIIIAVIMVVFFLLMYVIYTKMVRRDIGDNSNKLVHEMVSSYIQFYEGKDKKNKEAV